MEGSSADPEIDVLRQRQMKNLAALLLLSHGTPMILAGDEIGRSQSGNNNAYCQDSPIAWTDWGLAESNRDLLRFFRNLIALRRRCALLRRATFLPDGAGLQAAIEWHGIEQQKPDWSWESRLIACHQFEIGAGDAAEHLYIVANAHWESHDCALPLLSSGVWRRIVDTSLAAPDDCVDTDRLGLSLRRERYRVGPRSVVVLARAQA